FFLWTARSATAGNYARAAHKKAPSSSARRRRFDFCLSEVDGRTAAPDPPPPKKQIKTGGGAPQAAVAFLWSAQAERTRLQPSGCPKKKAERPRRRREARSLHGRCVHLSHLTSQLN